MRGSSSCTSGSESSGSPPWPTLGKQDQATSRPESPSLHTPLFNDSSVTVLVACYMIVDQLQRSSIPLTRQREWWDLISTLLPVGHQLPSFDVATRAITDLAAITPVEFHVCPNDCVIFRDRPLHIPGAAEHQHANRTHCPVCGTARYKDEAETKPAKKFTWLGINNQLKARFWFKEWQDAIILDMVLIIYYLIQ
jgi:hypothetical protein